MANTPLPREQPGVTVMVVSDYRPGEQKSWNDLRKTLAALANQEFDEPIEYLLLENRSKKGFDQSLPAEGLLIWRVVGNRPILQEAHGVEGPAGPRSFISSVPFPSAANDSFTPYTIPSSRSPNGGGLPVHITNVRKLADGRITFHIGYEYQ